MAPVGNGENGSRHLVRRQCEHNLIEGVPKPLLINVPITHLNTSGRNLRKMNFREELNSEKMRFSQPLNIWTFVAFSPAILTPSP